MNLAFLWRIGNASDFGQAQDATLLALTKMAQGGIYDQLGGGFHRYSVDAHWSVPHFEKMLYDNGLLLKLYAEVLLTADPATLKDEDRELYLEVLEGTVSYVLREMRAPEGAFYSAQDADSEGEEGKFFAWNPNSIAEHLNGEEARVFSLRYGVEASGNFEHGQTVLYQALPVTEVAQMTQLSEERVRELLISAREKLFQARAKRVAPMTDNKILTSWNALLISGLAWASRALRVHGNHAELSEKAWESAVVAMEFIRTHMNHGGNEDRLWSVYKDGRARFNGYLDDYAFSTMAALDLARFSTDRTEFDALLVQANRWIGIVRKRFTDSEQGGFFFTSDDHEKLIQRPKTIFDQSIPSGIAISLQCMLALSELLDGLSHETEADEHLYRLIPSLERAPAGMGELANAALLYLMGPVTVSGPNASECSAHPHVFQKEALQGSSEYLVCHRKSCSLPLTGVEAARKMAKEKTRL